MSKHTQGPWKYDIGDNEISHIGGPIATVFGVEDFPCLDPEEHDLKLIAGEMAANGRLIASAPELLEAAKCLLDFWKNGTAVQPGSLVAIELQAVIAKAEGQ